MAKKSTKTAAAAVVEADDIDALLEGDIAVPEALLAINDDIDALIEDAPVETITETPVDDVLLALHEDDVAAEAAKRNEEFYAEAESTIGVSDEEDAAPVKSKRTKKVAGTSSTRKAGPAGEEAARLSRSATLLAKGNLEQLTKMGFAEDDIPDLVARIETLPLKVQDKAYNLIRYMAGREQLSGYTRFVLDRLTTEGPQTVPQIVEAMLARGTWKTGTARSQSQQISRLFRAYGFLADEGRTMTLDTSKPFVSNLIARYKGEEIAA